MESSICVKIFNQCVSCFILRKEKPSQITDTVIATAPIKTKMGGNPK